ncbi:unnamed protein product [Coccothraustes coccothraustes]
MPVMFGFALRVSKQPRCTVLDVFEGCEENDSYVRLRSSRLSSARAVRHPEAKKRLLRALSIVPVAVLSKARLLPKAARDRRLAAGSFTLQRPRFPAPGGEEAASSRTEHCAGGGALKVRLLTKAARDMRFASGSSRLASNAYLSASIFAESFSTLSHKEKLC